MVNVSGVPAVDASAGCAEPCQESADNVVPQQDGSQSVVLPSRTPGAAMGLEERHAWFALRKEGTSTGGRSTVDSSELLAISEEPGCTELAEPEVSEDMVMDTLREDEKEDMPAWEAVASRLGTSPAARSPVDPAVDPAPLGAQGQRRPAGRCKVQDLGSFLEKLSLEEYTEAAHSWCQEMGAVSLEEIAENIALFCEGVGLKPLECQRAWKWATQELTSGRSLLRAEGASREDSASGAEGDFVEVSRSVRLAVDSHGNMGLELRWDRERGILVDHVEPLPGQPGGLAAGDYIVSIDGCPLRHRSHEECSRILAEHLYDGAVLSTVTLVPAVDPWEAQAPVADAADVAEGRGRGTASSAKENWGMDTRSHRQGDPDQKRDAKARGKYEKPRISAPRPGAGLHSRHHGFSANKMWQRSVAGSQWPPHYSGGG